MSLQDRLTAASSREQYVAVLKITLHEPATASAFNCFGCSPSGQISIEAANFTVSLHLPSTRTLLNRATRLQVSPTSNYMAVVLVDTSSAGGQTGVAVYPINSDGTLGTSTSLLTFSPAERYRPVLTWDSTGTYLFVSYFGGIAEYHYNPAANSLVPVESEIGSTTPPTSMTFLDGHLFVVNYDHPYLSIYNFADGSLRAAPMPPFGHSLGFNPMSIAALRH